MIRAIVKSQIMLKRPARPAHEGDLVIAADLAETLASHRGSCVGMAANMIGQSVAIIAYLDEADGPDGQPRVMLNPKLVSSSGPYETEEGCLSLVGKRSCQRFRTICVRWQDQAFAWHEQTFHGWTAQIIQHELDHLQGIII